MDIAKRLKKMAKNYPKTIVLPEAEFSARIVEAGVRAVEQGICNIVLIGDPKKIDISWAKKLRGQIEIIDPKSSVKLPQVINAIFEARKHKGLTIDDAARLAIDPIYFAMGYCVCGYGDGVVCGAEVPTASTLRPALQVIKSRQGLVSSYFIFAGKNRVTAECFLMGDCAVVENPTAEQEALIAEMMLEEYNSLGLLKPCCAFLSYSTLGSADSQSVQKVRRAYEIFCAKNPRIMAIGETQFDACVNEKVRAKKMPNAVQNRPANIFVMPNLDAGNIAYKITQYFGGLQAIGPITTGFAVPVNDLSRGCSVDDAVLVIAVTAIQASRS